MQLKLSSTGDVVAATMLIDGRSIDKVLGIRTVLPGWRVDQVSSASLAGGVVQFDKRLVYQEDSVRLIERFVPREESVRWEITVEYAGKPAVFTVKTEMVWADSPQARFWAAWSIFDPLQPRPFEDLEMGYGGDLYRTDDVSIPVATVIEPEHDLGVSLVPWIENNSFQGLSTTKSGDVALTNETPPVGSGKSWTLGLDLVAHPADWRAGLGWASRRYPQYFDPPNPLAHDVAGCGAYSAYGGELDVKRFHRMAFRVNWNAHFDWPYLGMYLPPVDRDETWTSWRGRTTSIRQINEYSRRMREMGFCVLNYFSVTHFGSKIVSSFLDTPAPPRKAKSDADLWKDPNDFLYYRLGGQTRLVEPKEWDGSATMDTSDPGFQAFLIDQARRHVEELPDSHGICIDRLDWFVAPWFKDWQKMMGEIGPIMHDAGKIILCNPLRNRRIIALRHVDGIYDEMPCIANLRADALLCMNKPLIMWNSPEGGAEASDIDEGFQTFLLLGAYPTVPFPENDHTVRPDQALEEYYLDYGPMMAAMRGKRWVLLPHVVEVVEGSARANVFAIPGGFVAPLVHGGDSSEAKVLLRGLPRLPGQGKPVIEVLHPGEIQWQKLPATFADEEVRIDVPLVRGCAMVRLLHSWVRPFDRYFDDQVTVDMGTVIEGGKIRYTLDGSVPTPESPVYTKPLALRKTTTVRMGVFVGDQMLGSVVSAQFATDPKHARTAAKND